MSLDNLTDEQIPAAIYILRKTKGERWAAIFQNSPLECEVADLLADKGIVAKHPLIPDSEIGRATAGALAAYGVVLNDASSEWDGAIYVTRS